MPVADKRFPTTDGPKIRVGTMSACCVRFWYDRFFAEKLPKSGEMACGTCRAIIKRDRGNWWKGSQKDTLA